MNRRPVPRYVDVVEVPELILGLLTAAGLIFVLIGVRDRRLGGRPSCRRCGYELVGKPARCSECGYRLGTRRSIRRERRVADVWVILVGASLAVPSAIVLTYISARSLQAQAATFNWNTLKTDSMLVGDLLDASPTVVEAARSTLLSRMEDGTVAPASASASIEHALALQKDRTIEWDTTWGDFILAAKDAGLLTTAQENRYVRQGCLVTLDARDRVRPRDPVRLGIEFESRLGTHDRRFIQVELSDVRVDDELKIESHILNLAFESDHRRADTMLIAVLHDPGTYVAKASMVVRWITMDSISERAFRFDNAHDAFRPGERIQSLPFREVFEVVGEGEPDVTLVTSADLESPMREAVSLKLIAEPALVIRVELDEPPTGLAMRISMPTREGAVDIGRFVAKKGMRGAIEVPAQGLAGYSLVTLVLTPDSGAARRRPGYEEVWGQSMTFENLRFEDE